MTVSQKEGLSFFMAIAWFFSGDLHKSIDVSHVFRWYFSMGIFLHCHGNVYGIAGKMVNAGKFNLFSKKIKKVFEFS